MCSFILTASFSHRDNVACWGMDAKLFTSSLSTSILTRLINLFIHLAWTTNIVSQHHAIGLNSSRKFVTFCCLKRYWTVLLNLTLNVIFLCCFDIRFDKHLVKHSLREYNAVTFFRHMYGISHTIQTCICGAFYCGYEMIFVLCQLFTHIPPGCRTTPTHIQRNKYVIIRSKRRFDVIMLCLFRSGFPRTPVTMKWPK